MNTNKERKQEVRRALHDHSLSAMVEMGWRGISNSSADHADNREDDEAPAFARLRRRRRMPSTEGTTNRDL